MQSMSVNPAQVSALAGQIRSGSQNIKSTLENLESEVNKLKGAWSGEALEAYNQAQRNWTVSVTEMNQLLSQIASKTEEISQQYTQTDNSAAGRFAL
jgi:early secretory antigenic target protein ESAT-6